MAQIRQGAVTLKGNPVDLAGTELKAGDAAPDFGLQSNSLEEVSLAAASGKTLIIATVPSLDTPVCHEETKKHHQVRTARCAAPCVVCCARHRSAGAELGEKEGDGPAHRGRTTHVWDVEVRNEDADRTIALFRCTQMILRR